jgi:hypothetical protein
MAQTKEQIQKRKHDMLDELTEWDARACKKRYFIIIFYNDKF